MRPFGDTFPELERTNATLVAVPVDAPFAQKAFAEKYRIAFPLIADSGKKVVSAYGVLGPRGLARRVTFLIDAQGKVVEVIDSSSPDPHLERARARFLTK